jgi:hypothetical protein
MIRIANFLFMPTVFQTLGMDADFGRALLAAAVAVGSD